MMSYRIVRAPERRVFYVDVGNIAPQDIEQHMLRFADQMKKNQIIDPDTGRVDLRYNPMSVEEDYFVAVRGQDNGTKIDVLPGGTMNNDIQDVKYLRDKLFSALKVPQSYLSRSEQGSEDKTTLAQKDIMFARTVQRLQRAIISELEKIGAVHLLTLGFHSEDVVNFKLSLNNPSQIAEIQQLEQLELNLRLPQMQQKDSLVVDGSLRTSSICLIRNSREINVRCSMTRRLMQIFNQLLLPKKVAEVVEASLRQ